jgi:hypothetical protein
MLLEAMSFRCATRLLVLEAMVAAPSRFRAHSRVHEGASRCKQQGNCKRVPKPLLKTGTPISYDQNAVCVVTSLRQRANLDFLSYYIIQFTEVFPLQSSDYIKILAGRISLVSNSSLTDAFLTSLELRQKAPPI